jgi:hypothetical protein
MGALESADYSHNAHTSKEDIMQTLGRSRPLGITIIAIILGVSAVLSLIVIIIGLVGVSSLGGALAGAATVALVIGAILAIAELVLAWGLWTLRPWAFWATAIVEAIRVLDGLYGLFVQHASLGSTILSLIFPIVILIYLFADRNVRAAFRT